MRALLVAAILLGPGAFRPDAAAGAPKNQNKSLQDTINAARPGSTVKIPAGVHTASLTIARSVILQGDGSGRTFLDGGGAARVLHVQKGARVIVRNLTVQNGAQLAPPALPARGAGILNEGDLTLDQVAVRGCAARGGLPVDYKPGGDAEGAGIFNLGRLVLSRSQISSNLCSAGGRAESPYYESERGAGGAARGAGVYNRGALYVMSSEVADNRCYGGMGIDTPGGGAQGGGIYNAGVLVAGAGTVLRGNVIQPGFPYQIGTPGLSQGGGIYSEGQALLNAIHAEANAAIHAGQGGAVFNRGVLRIDGGRILRNEAMKGAALFNAGNADLRNTVFDGNGLNEPDGSFYESADAALLNVATCRTERCTFLGNRGWAGGAIHNAGWMNMSQDRVVSNRARWGGGLYSLGRLNVSTCEISFNLAEGLDRDLGNAQSVAAEGGGVFNGGTLTCTDTRLLNNCVTTPVAFIAGYAWGGGASDHGTSSWLRCTFEGNRAQGGRGSFGGDAGGGGLSAGGDTMVKACSVIGNTAIAGTSPGWGPARYTGGDATGGGIQNRGRLLVDTSTVSGNRADGSAFGCGAKGGGIASYGELDLVSATICSNRVDGSGDIETTSAVIDLGGRGGGLYAENTAVLRNTILALNEASNTGPDLQGTATSDGYNLFATSMTNGAIINLQATDLAGVHPLLGPLSTNGGPTRTHALLAGSPAVDRGIADGATTDQRGRRRPVDQPGIPNAADGADIGAFELQ